MKQKRALIIQDISTIGRLSSMVAIPILSGSGINTSCLPTAILSTHTEPSGYFFKDLSEEMTEITNHWSSMGVKFDAIQTGYLGNEKQIKIVKKAFRLSKKETIFVVDPAMADNGKMYKGINENMVKSMQDLCANADIIIPNLTEAHFLLGLEYQDKRSDIPYVESIIKKLVGKFENKYIVITGVSNKENCYGSMCYDNTNGKIEYFQREYIQKSYYGTGDIFASVITASILNGKSIFDACDIATDFTQSCVKISYEMGYEKEDGVCFEKNIPILLKKLGKFK